MKYAILGEKYRNILENGIISANLVPIWLPNNPDVDERLAGHADLSLLYDGNNRLLAAPYLRNYPDFLRKMQEMGLFVQFVPEQGRGYPQDAGLNVLVCGNIVVCNEKTAHPAALDMLEDRELICVKQGYTNCAVCCIADRAAITADRGVAVQLSKHGWDILLIQSGYIDLIGFEYGFIGGAAFLIDEGKIAFTGALDKHADHDRIMAFLDKYSVKPIFLSKAGAFDIGSSIIINNRTC